MPHGSREKLLYEKVWRKETVLKHNSETNHRRLAWFMTCIQDRKKEWTKIQDLFLTNKKRKSRNKKSCCNPSLLHVGRGVTARQEKEKCTDSTNTYFLCRRFWTAARCLTGSRSKADSQRHQDGGSVNTLVSRQGQGHLLCLPQWLGVSL